VVPIVEIVYGIVTDVKSVQPLHILLPNVVMLFVKKSVAKVEQLLNALS
jgi:hypothetical protein